MVGPTDFGLGNAGHSSDSPAPFIALSRYMGLASVFQGTPLQMSVLVDVVVRFASHGDLLPGDTGLALAPVILSTSIPNAPEIGWRTWPRSGR